MVFSQTFARVYQTTRRHIPAHRDIDTYRHENMTFHYHHVISPHTTHEIGTVSLNTLHDNSQILNTCEILGYTSGYAEN